MFTGEHLGPSRDNFSTNLARLKNLRQRIEREHQARDAVLAAVVAEVPDDAPAWTRGIDLHWMARDQREWLQSEHNTTLEMMLIYIMGMLDTFLGQWGNEHRLWEGKWPSAHPERFAEIGLPLRPETAQTLIEYRARRDVLIHRGGIADAKYCKLVGDDRMLERRLPVDEGYLDAAVEFVDYLVAATAVARHEGPPRHEAKTLWPELIARVFVS